MFLEFSKSVFRLHINNLIEQDFMEGQSEGNALNTKSVGSKMKKIFLKFPKIKLRNHNNNESEHEFRDS